MRLKFSILVLWEKTYQIFLYVKRDTVTDKELDTVFEELYKS